ncbi:hypothetical protein CEXT_467941 [Caerostris extrusa]|uniref:Uncharacterized protein n=1 Tax=Caerostris extrusa TaxID=172846 RepID=A0AAV4V9W4_CAEEX|nr:hypothetical protein CEXT_467941 [Caerostris extrusa]
MGIRRVFPSLNFSGELRGEGGRKIFLLQSCASLQLEVLPSLRQHKCRVLLCERKSSPFAYVIFFSRCHATTPASVRGRCGTRQDSSLHKRVGVVVKL